MAELRFRLDEDPLEVVLVADVALHEADILVADAGLLGRHLVANHDARAVKRESGGSKFIQIFNLSSWFFIFAAFSHHYYCPEIIL